MSDRIPTPGVGAGRGVGLGSPPRGRGRPRDTTLDDRILEQVVVLLGSHGYAGLTLDELAARSGVAKTTILRRWASKAAVAAAGVERLALQSVDVPDSGTLRGDLCALLHGAVETFVRGRGQFVPRLLREAGHHPEIADLLYTVVHTRRQAYRRALALAIARGELAPTVDQDLLIDLLIGPTWTRLLITRDPITREYVDANVDAVLTAFGVTPARTR
ncbi:TetR family transcriptional regulator [Geodermatophilus tzadiensis]|uniref:TetR family transcriptional regulator n=1 Tax=Geodermatophilus tzadiensis TaxID=1137988 RepID=A0A2T0U1J3_9ACTN|nr:TetR/AcrR family transcriptional regulator [Geodermatophilus tzadiensis]PRY51773.1 TetR family transcriptional regulator [Geodermatophilus tzadiensis]